MSKYVSLTTYLAALDQGVWETTFEEIEKILRFPLPLSARQYQAWWANQMRSQSLSWQSVGWKTAGVDLDRERVTFVAVNDVDEGDHEAPTVKCLTILDAKIGLAASFGINPDQIEITIRA